MILRTRGSGLLDYFLLVAVGLYVAAFSGAALAWDGSVYLFQLLDDQRPFVPHYRFVNVVLQAPVLALSLVTSDLTVLRVAFGLVYTSIPLVVLAACWWVVRLRAPRLFVWAALGIGFGLMPGQFNFVGEASLAVLLFWPLGLAILVGLPRQQAPLAAVVTVLILVTHPVAAALFALAAAMSVVVGLRAPESRRALWTWALVFGGLVLATGLRLWLLRTPYEVEQSSPEILRWSFAVSVIGLPMLALSVAVVVATTILVAARFCGHSRIVTAMRGAEIVGIALITLLLIRWAVDPDQWRWALKYGYWAPIGSLLFLGFAALEVHISRHTVKDTPQVDAAAARDPIHDPIWAHRVRTAQLVALSCSVVLIVQSATWLHLSNRLIESMTQSGWGCLPMSRLGWLDDTPLSSFATPAYSVLLQGRTPNKVVLSGDACSTETFNRGVALHEFATRSLSQGWFNLQPLADVLEREHDVPRNGCTFSLTSGWHQTETNDPFWWRWSDGRKAQLRTVVAAAGTLTLHGQIETAQVPNRVAVVVNGRQQAVVEVTWKALQEFPPFGLALQPGVNTIELLGQNAPIEIEHRPLSFGVANMTATYGEGSTTCALHP